jgi:hypothetical protein
MDLLLQLHAGEAPAALETWKVGFTGCGVGLVCLGGTDTAAVKALLSGQHAAAAGAVAWTGTVAVSYSKTALLGAFGLFIPCAPPSFATG